MSILLFGSSGKLGTALSAEALKRGVSISAAESRDWTKGLPPIPNLPYDAIINCAAMTDVDDCEIRQRDCFFVNGLSPAILAAEAACRHVPFVQISSDYVFSRKLFNSWLIGEDADREPCNYYGVSKAFMEECLTHLMLVDRGGFSPLWILRTSNLYGNSAGKPDIFRRFIEEAVSQKRITLKGQMHTNIFTPTHAGDLAKVILDILERRPPSGIYNAVGTQTATVMDIAVFIAGIMQEKGMNDIRVVPVIAPDSPVPRPVDVILGCAKLAASGITPPLPWTDRAMGYAEEVLEVIGAT